MNIKLPSSKKKKISCFGFNTDLISSMNFMQNIIRPKSPPALLDGVPDDEYVRYDC